MHDSLLFIFLVTAVVSVLVTPAVIVLYRRAGWVDRPDRKKPTTTHERAVPRGGGIAIAAAVLVGALLFIRVDQHLIGILLGVILLMLVGVLDDRLNLNPYLRLFFQFLAAGLVVASGIGIPYINVPFVGVVPLDQPKLVFHLMGEERSIWILADLFALVWIVGLMNAVNWSKGLDGQLPGIVVVAALTIGFLSLRFGADIMEWPVLTLSLVTAGAFSGFLPWNFYPQKIMPGFGGGTLGGYLLAILSILSTAKVGTLLVVLGVPLADAGYAITRRVLQKKSPVWGDRGHLHHRLLDNLKWSKRQIALFYWGVTALLGSIALQLNSQQKFYTMLGIILVIGGILLWLTHSGPSSKPRGRNGG